MELHGRVPAAARPGQHRQCVPRRWRQPAPQRPGRPACRRAQPRAAVADAPQLQAEDKWIEQTLNAVSPHAGDAGDRLRGLREACRQSLRSQRMPTTRNEEYRYTDLSALLRTPTQAAEGSVQAAQLAEHALAPDADPIRLVLVNGRLSAEHSSVGQLPPGAFVGGLAEAPASAAELLGSQAAMRGSPFALLNGALAAEALVVALEEGVELERPVHVLHLTSGSAQEGSLAVASPRLLVSLAARASCQVVEEFATAAGGSARHFTNAAAELWLGEGASLRHGYVELEGGEAWHMKGTLVLQEARSRYQLTECQLGGRLSRHDLAVQQAGPETETVMRHFLLAGGAQLHDLHSKLRLERPGGTADQLHKCIVAASSGRGVFDGNVRVARAAQQTDAAQLSRNLLLAPKATVNVKPNLQIVADDVKCSHGCAVSDLEEDQLFYFRARGVDDATARQVLVYSFGSEVTQHLRFPALLQRLQARVNASLAGVAVV